VTKTFFVIVLMCLLPCACAADAGESLITKSESALTVPGQTAVPCAGWNGTKVELLLADALAGCSGWIDDQAKTGLFPLADQSLRNVAAHMAAVVFSSEFLTFDWRELRADEQKNCDPNNPEQHIAVNIVETPVEESLYLGQAPVVGQEDQRPARREAPRG